MMENQFNHITVLLKETVEGLSIKPGGVYVDCTLGGGGHSSLILEEIDKNGGFLYCLDQDDDAINATRPKLEKISDKFEIIKCNFENMKEELNKREITQVDGILMDLGISSHQIDTAERGFSYRFDAPLDMRMDVNNTFSAYEIVNEWEAFDIARILWKYGEERFAKKIAQNMVKQRAIKPIETTFELVEIIKESIPAKFKRDKHPARKTFQALRIAVNDELGVLERILEDGLEMLNETGRFSIITFHSLEDRIVKQFFRKNSEVPAEVRGLPNIPEQYRAKLMFINKKPIEASKEELEANSRSRSAKLRIAEKL